METASESGAELFKVEYFGRTAYLAQSPQFYKQMAMAAGFDRIFEIGPVFRANPSFTSRHDTEFTSVDVEISWIESHNDVMKLEEEWVRFMLISIKKELGDEIKELYGTEITIPEIPFPRVTMEEAYAILGSKGYTVAREKGDLDPEGERILAAYVKDKFGHDFVFVIDWPVSVRAFYHMRCENNPGLTKSFDLLWSGLEVTTGAQREHRYDILARQAQEKGFALGPLQHYLDFFKYGCPPHGGYGFGLTRMLMILLGLKNVREVTYLYRGPNRLSP
jgi:aspartyl-tRNA synthetase